MFELLPGEKLLAVCWSYGLAGEDSPDDYDAGCWHFGYSGGASPEEALRDAVRDYLTSPNGNPNGYAHFNWGDAIDEVPKEIWAKYGLRELPEEYAELRVTVDHDEQLLPEDDDWGDYDAGA
jgi:hypothetical protein